MQSTSKLRTTVNVAAPTAVLARVEVIINLHHLTIYSVRSVRSVKWALLITSKALSVDGIVPRIEAIASSHHSIACVHDYIITSLPTFTSTITSYHLQPPP
jgi:hypothetical protein